MNNIEILELALKNQKFHVHINGLFRNDGSISYTAKCDISSIKIIPYADSVLAYGNFRGLGNDVLNIIRKEFKIGYKEVYTSDALLEEEFIKRIEREPLFSLYKNKILSIDYHYRPDRDGKLQRIIIKSSEGVVVEFHGIESTNIDKNKKVIDKFDA